MKAGDIPPYSLLFFRGTGFISRWIGRLSGANLEGPTHVEMVLPPDAALLFGLPPQPVSFGATTIADTPDLVSGELRSGVQLFNLRDRLEQYTGTHIWIRECESDYRRMTAAMNSFVRREHGKPYEEHPLRLLGVVIDWPWIDRLFNADSEESRFCSELSVRMLRLLSMWTFTCGQFVPAEEYSPMDLFRWPLVHHKEAVRIR